MTLDRPQTELPRSVKDGDHDAPAAEFADALAPEVQLPEAGHKPAPVQKPIPELAARRRWLIAAGVAAVVLIGLNLRAGIASAAALFHDLQQLLGYGPLVAALLPTVPVLCFALAGAAT